MTRSIFIAAALALAGALPAAPSYAGSVTFVSSTGAGAGCSYTQPCSDFAIAVGNAVGNGGGTGRVVCLSPAYVGNPADAIFVQFSNTVLEIDCPAGAFLASLAFQATNDTGRVRGLTFIGSSNGSALAFQGSGTLILEDCVFEDSPGIALDIEPNGPLNLVIRNSRISNSAGAGVLIKPAAGGSVTATFDGVTITKNAGGLRTDTTNGSVTVDISNSTISTNANNGIVVLGGAGGSNMVTAKNDVIASNGQAGIEASGGTAGVLVNNTVLDSNTGGATLAVSGGRILTYGNNSTIGAPGSGFTGTAPLN